MLSQFVVLALSFRSAYAMDGLTDHPIASEAVDYLSGPWTASATIMPPRGADCTFMADTDYNHGKIGAHSASSSKEDCCAQCAKNDDCAAAVFAGNSCWFKNTDDMQKKSTVKGVSACVPEAVPPSQGHHITIPAAVPGDLLTDLQKAGMIGDPLYELNFLNASIWDANTWTYSTTFSVTQGGTKLLVFDGIKMGARVLLDGKLLGNTTDQFLRYTFPLELTADAKHKLEVVFDPRIDCGGRWMSCTGGWDWAPYTNTAQNGIPTFSKGIWKAVSVVHVEQASAVITEMVPQITYAGDYPVEPLTDSSHAGFNVAVRVHLWALKPTSGTVHVSGAWGGEATSKVSVPAGNSSVVIELPVAKDVKLWWPVGLGSQPLYNLTTEFTGSSTPNAAPISTERRVGFRFFALVTGNDTDPAYVAASKGADGTGKLGMLWRINGAAIFSKGANMIPMEELEGRMAANAHRQLVQAAVDGGMNTLRVWGGGMFLPRVWYEACDELGIMVYHDMQYAQSGHSPVNEPIQDAELRHQIRRLASHTSIVMWDGCNECRVIMGSNTGVYATFVMTVVAQEDQSRVVWPSCPALGWTTGVDRLTSIPNGKPLTTPSGGAAIETHGPYQHGTGFPAVNGAGQFQPVSPSMNGGNPISLTPQANLTAEGVYIGLGKANIFASEFGSSVYSSFESMAPTIAPEHWSIHGGAPPDKCGGGFASHCEGDNVMAQRNYPCDNIIVEYFGKSDFETVGEHQFKQQLWQCMVGQALLVKSDIETRRSQNQFGIIVWQFNEIWPTGGWGSIEYGTVGFTKGQVLGGRWKPLHHWYKASIFADVMATCGNQNTPHEHENKVICYIKNDSPLAFKGNVDVSSLQFSSGAKHTVTTMAVDMPAGAGTIQWFELPRLINGTQEMLLVSVSDSSGAPMSNNPVAFAHPKDMSLPKAHVTFQVGTQPAAGAPVPVTVTSDSFALYVTLTSLAQGRFEDNAFVMLPGKKVVKFYPFEGFSIQELKSSLRVEHTATYM